MAIQTINIGAADNDGTGDKARPAFQKINQNFSKLDNRTTAAQARADKGVADAATAKARADAGVTNAATAQAAANSANINANNRVARSGDAMTGPLDLSLSAITASNSSAGLLKAAFVFSPAGGIWSAPANTTVGAIRIKLPQINGRRAMVRAELEVMQYGSASVNSPDMVSIYGYSDTSAWQNCTAVVLGRGRLNAIPVRFGRDENNRYIYLGELNHSWIYCRILIRSISITYDNSGVDAGDWAKNWAIDTVTEFATVDQVVTDTLPQGKAAIADIAGFQDAVVAFGGVLNGSPNLRDYTDRAVRTVNSSSVAAAGSNFPIVQGGSLLSLSSAPVGQTFTAAGQIYHAHNSNRLFMSSVAAGNWNAWKELISAEDSGVGGPTPPRVSTLNAIMNTGAVMVNSGDVGSPDPALGWMAWTQRGVANQTFQLAMPMTAGAINRRRLRWRSSWDGTGTDNADWVEAQLFFGIPASNANMLALADRGRYTIYSNEFAQGLAGLPVKRAGHFDVHNFSTNNSSISQAYHEFTTYEGRKFISASGRSDFDEISTHQNRFNTPLKQASFTLATLPSAALWVDATIVVTNATGGRKLCVSNGSVWQIANTTTTVS